MDGLSHGGRPVAGFGLSAAPAAPSSPSTKAFAGALTGGFVGLIAGIFVGGAVYDAEGQYGHARSGVNATGPVLAGSATTLVGAVVGAWLATPSTSPTT